MQPLTNVNHLKAMNVIDAKVISESTEIDYLELETKYISEIINGDIDTLEVIYNQYSKVLLNLSYKTTLDHDLSQDIIHDVFVDLPELLKKFRNKSKLSTWLYRVVHNRSIEKIRTQSNRLRILKDKVFPYFSQELNDANSDNTSGNDEVNKKLNHVLKSLNSTTRSMLWLKDAEGLTISELTEIFGLNEGTIKSKLSRARKMLYKKLSSELNYE